MEQLLSINQLDRSNIERYINQANQFKEAKTKAASDNSRIVGLAFFQDSVRTRTGFESAAYRLGHQVVHLFSGKSTVDMAGEKESDWDALRCFNDYVDLLVLRHEDKNIFSNLTTRKLINAGNGSEEHPTQTLIDLYTIYQELGRIDGLNIAIVGDLFSMRTSHSLSLALAKFRNIKVVGISPQELVLPERFRTASFQASDKMDLSEQILYT